MIPVFDGHCDTLFLLEITNSPYGALKSNKFHVDLDRLGAYSPSAQFFAVWGEKDMFPGEGVFKRLTKRFFKEAELAADKLMHCRSASDAEKAKQSGKIAAFLSVEGAELIDCERGLDAAYDKGVRAVTLTWNNPNELSGTNINDSERGLSAAGRSFVRRCQSLGVIVDVSHLSDPGFWDVIDIAEKPVIASHSNSRAVCKHTRNLTDEQFKAIRDTGGTVGINLFSDFLCEKPESADIDTCIRHIEHFLNLNGEKTLALGADFDGCMALPEGINGVQGWSLIYNELKNRGYGEKLLNDIFYNNLMRVVQSI